MKKSSRELAGPLDFELVLEIDEDVRHALPSLGLINYYKLESCFRPRVMDGKPTSFCYEVRYRIS